MSTAVEHATRRVGWIPALQWAPGIALSMVLITGLSVWAFLPRVEGLTRHDLWAGATRLRPCEIGKEAHVCVVTDDKARALKDPDGEPVVVVRGM